MENSSCVVCFREVKIFAVGSCDHPICHICSTRLRVLCKQNECPICRRDLPKVYFSSSLCKYGDVKIWRQRVVNHRFQICFMDENVKVEFYKLLEHSCGDCSSGFNFKSFTLLAEHVRKVHEKFFCDLCCEHLRIFTHERKAYHRRDLAKHRRVGDTNDTSHRGHPLCSFCDKRFMDNDILFKHLRRDHFFCHFCDSDGTNEYYGDYGSLRNHFRAKHFLCEEDKCRDEKFTSVFRSNIDLKAHKSQVHSHSMSKAQSKQTRTLEIEFAMAPRAQQNMGASRPSLHGAANNVSGRKNGQQHVSGRNIPTGNITTIRAPLSVPEQPNGSNSQNINTNCQSEFPTLDGSSFSADLSQPMRPGSKSLADKLAANNRFTVRNNETIDDEDFPSLSLSQVSQPALNYSNASGVAANTKLSMSSTKKGMFKVDDTEDFPSLSKANPKKSATNPSQPHQAHNISIKVNHKHPSSPSSAAGYLSNPNWSTKGKITSIQSTVPINDSGGKKTSTSSQKKFISSVVPNEKSFPALGSSSGATSAPPVEGAWKTAKNDDKNAPFVTIKSKKKKGKKSNQSEDVHGNDANKKKKSGDRGSNLELSTNNDKSKAPENQENVNPSLTLLNQLCLTSDESETEENGSKNGNKIGETNNNIYKNNDDFPTLPPSLRPRLPPPGFSSSVPDNKSCVPPPGFNSATVPVSNPSSDVSPVTFTNGSGQDCSFTAHDYSYSEPGNFNERNRHLILTIKSVLEDNDFDNFKKLSSDFRKGGLPAKDYYKKCVEMLGNKDFDNIFIELMVLLPDIEKQQQLLSVYNSYLKSRGASKDTKPKDDNAWICHDFVVCTACRQVLSQNDFRNHIILHNLESNFPSLPNLDGTKI